MEMSTAEASMEANNTNDKKAKPEQNKIACQLLKLLPTEKTLRQISTQLLTFALLYLTLWGIFQKHALPGSGIFAVFILVVLCSVAGRLVKLIRLPPLIGMLVAGFLFRNLKFIPYSKDIPDKWAANFRSAALVIVLLHAGLGLNPTVLKRMSLLCLRLACMPCLAEAFSGGIAAHFLFGLPWAWSFCLGFILGAVSPAIIIPSMLLLECKGFGKDKGIATLIIASSSIDDVFAIAGFGVCVGIAFSQGNLAWTLLKGPIEVISGLIYGVLVGVFCWYLPHEKEKYKTYYRISMLMFGGLAVTFVSQVVDFSAAGALGCLGLAFVAAFRWRQEIDKNAPVEKFLSDIWKMSQAFLFGLIGAEVSVAELEKDIGYAVVVLVIGLTFRILVSYLSLCGSNLSLKEKVFVAFAWLPKATVQAAIGSVALDMARISNLGPEYIAYGKQILTVSVLSILCTAPLGAVAIAILGPFLLNRTLDAQGEKSVEVIVNNDAVMSESNPSTSQPPAVIRVSGDSCESHL